MLTVAEFRKYRRNPEPRTRIYHTQQVVLSLQFAVCFDSTPGYRGRSRLYHHNARESAE
jgi:hypothetical protein